MWRRVVSSSSPGLRAGRRRSVSVVSAGQAKSYFLETHGCQMNVSDSEIVRAIMQRAGWSEASSADGARVLLTNTCSIREKAENKVRTRLSQWRAADRTRKLGVLGCMASRLRSDLIESGAADIVAGPDSYRHLPELIDALDGGASHAIHTQLSLEETYADIAPVRASASGDSPTAYVTVMRGCNNMCSYCVVPFTRGRERSRALDTIVGEVRGLVERGVREVVLLGQNVNSYWDRTSAPSGEGGGPSAGYQTAEGFGNMFKSREGEGARFAHLLAEVAAVSPELRVRFTSPHPKDFPESLLDVIARTPNVCKQLHLPAQSGSSAVLARMRREYSREAYSALAARARAMIPGLTLSTDLIAGFCGESEAEHAQTLELLREVRYEQAFMYAYSLRSKTHAAHHLDDDVPRETKQRRLREIIDTFHAHAQARNEADDLGAVHVVLVEGAARKSSGLLTGRSDGNKRVVFEDPSASAPRVGEYALVRVEHVTGHTLRGTRCGAAELGGAPAPSTLAECTALAQRLSSRRAEYLAARRAAPHGAGSAAVAGADELRPGKVAAREVLL